MFFSSQAQLAILVCTTTKVTMLPFYKIFFFQKFMFFPFFCLFIYYRWKLFYSQASNRINHLVISFLIILTPDIQCAPTHNKMADPFCLYFYTPFAHSHCLPTSMFGAHLAARRHRHRCHCSFSFFSISNFIALSLLYISRFSLFSFLPRCYFSLFSLNFFLILDWEHCYSIEVLLFSFLYLRLVDVGEMNIAANKRKLCIHNTCVLCTQKKVGIFSVHAR